MHLPKIYSNLRGCSGPLCRLGQVCFQPLWPLRSPARLDPVGAKTHIHSCFTMESNGPRAERCLLCTSRRDFSSCNRASSCMLVPVPSGAYLATSDECGHKMWPTAPASCLRISSAACIFAPSSIRQLKIFSAGINTSMICQPRSCFQQSPANHRLLCEGLPHSSLLLQATQI